jgi:hypothetical protein
MASVVAMALNVCNTMICFGANMRKPIVFGSTVLAVLAAAAAVTCAATSTPQKKKSPPPTDWVKIESKTLTYFVPKTWTPQGSEGQETFDLTPPKMKEKGRDFGTLQITAAQTPAATLDSVTADMRESLPKAAPNTRLSRDTATTVGDHPAWEFIVETSTKTQAPTPSFTPGGGEGAMHDVIKRSHTYIVVAVEGDMVYQATLKAEGSAFGNGVSMTNRVLDTFEIAPAPASAAAGNSTASTSTPAASVADAAPAGTVKVENKTYHYQFFVPRSWDRNVVNETQVAYLLPKHFGQKLSGLFLLVAGKCHQTTLDGEIADARKEFAARPDTKIIIDQSAQLGGKPAWVLSSESVVSAPAPAPAGQPPRQVKHVIKTYHIISVVDAVIYDVSVIGEGEGYDLDLASVKRMLESFTWTTTGAK